MLAGFFLGCHFLLANALWHRISDWLPLVRARGWCLEVGLMSQHALLLAAGNPFRSSTSGRFVEAALGVFLFWHSWNDTPYLLCTRVVFSLRTPFGNPRCRRVYKLAIVCSGPFAHSTVFCRCFRIAFRLGRRIFLTGCRQRRPCSFSAVSFPAARDYAQFLFTTAFFWTFLVFNAA